jgi:hypothetical protein
MASTKEASRVPANQTIAALTRSRPKLSASGSAWKSGIIERVRRSALLKTDRA